MIRSARRGSSAAPSANCVKTASDSRPRNGCFSATGVRVQPQSGDEGPALTVTRMFVDNEPARKALRGSGCSCSATSRSRRRARLQDRRKALRITLKELAALPPAARKAEPRLEAHGLENRNRTYECAVPALGTRPFASGGLVAPGHGGDARKGVRGGRFGAVRARRFRCEIDGGYFLPASELKSLRRAFWDEVKSVAPARAAPSGSPRSAGKVPPRLS